MTGRERILAALRGDPPGRVPVMLHNFLPAAREAGIPMGRFRRDGRAIAEAFRRAVETYGYDGVLVDVDTVMLAGAVGVPVDAPDDAPARPRGPLLRSLDEIDRLPRDVRIEAHPSIAAACEAVSRLREAFGGEVAVRGNCDQAPFSLAALIRGLDGWMTDLAEGDEPAITRLLAYAAGVTSRFLRLMADAGADVLSNGDSPAGTELISPVMHRRFAHPSEREMAGLSHALGRPYILHICGRVDPLLADMAATGADGLEVDQRTDARRARAVLAGRTTFVGNIDPAAVLAMGTPAAVERATRDLLKVFAGEPRFILNAGCAIPAETPPENIRTMIKVARGWR